MCIFSQPVVSVTDTNIFARLLPDGWQHLVYQMNFKSTVENAIVLPLPVQRPATDEDSLEFVSLKEYGNFFKDLGKGFPLALPERPMSRSMVDSKTTSSRPRLQVHEVGDFIASFVPQMADFDRLDEQFRVPKESWDQIPQYSDYGFAVFQLKTLQGQPHPMAFKFKSRLNTPENKSIFFPTVHIHDGDVHSREKFDHTLYLQAKEFDDACGRYQQQPKLVADSATGYVRSKWAAAKFCKIASSKKIVSPQQLVHRRTMQGTLANTDIVANLNLSHASFIPQTLPGKGLASLVCLSAVVGLGWFFNRRNTVAGTQAAEPIESPEAALLQADDGIQPPHFD